MKKHMKKLIVGLCCTVITSFSVVGYAQESINEETNLQPRIADWAVKDMHEAEASGILPINWESTLNHTISEQQLEHIMDGLKVKFEQIGLEEKIHEPTEVEENNLEEANTRKAIITAYYDLMNQYNTLSKDLELLDYMKNAGIISGETEEQLRLEEACTVQEAVLFANRTLRHVYTELDAGAKGLVWEVSDEDNTVYLLGSIHLAEAKNYPFHHDLNEIIEEVDKIAFEVNFYDQEGLVYLQQKQFYTEGETLKDHLPEELYTKVIEIGNKYGISSEIINHIKPWALSNTFSQVLSNLGTSGVETSEAMVQIPIIDTYVYTRALLNQKEIIEMEGYAFQADLFDSMALEVQVEQLSSVTESLLNFSEGEEDELLEESIASIQTWLESFYEGDEQRFSESYPKDEMLAIGSPLEQLLFEGRDHHMSKQVLDYLEDTENDYMVVVGAAHMIGNEGIVQQLIDAGYTVNSVE